MTDSAQLKVDNLGETLEDIERSIKDQESFVWTQYQVACDKAEREFFLHREWMIKQSEAKKIETIAEIDRIVSGEIANLLLDFSQDKITLEKQAHKLLADLERRSQDAIFLRDQVDVRKELVSQELNVHHNLGRKFLEENSPDMRSSWSQNRKSMVA